MDNIQSSLDYHHTKKDPQDNLSTSLPDGESVRVSAIWVIDAFTPSLINNLSEGARKLGWTENGTSLNPDFVEKINDMRLGSSAGGWLNLGYIISSDKKRFTPHQLQAPLPEGISAICASVLQPFPCTTLLCCKFILEDELASSLKQPYSEHFTTYAEQVDPHLVRLISVAQQKHQAVSVMRDYLRSLCTSWMNEYFPGHFSLGEAGSLAPTCELLLFNQEKDFLRTKASFSEPHFLEMLNLEYRHDRWKAESLSNFFLKFEPKKPKHPAKATLYGNIEEVLDKSDIEAFGEDRKDKILGYLDDLDQSLCTWALAVMADDFVADMGRTRDQYGSLDIDNELLNLEEIRSLDKNLVNFQRNAIPFALDLKNYCQDENYFMHNVYRFHSVEKWRGEYSFLFQIIKQRLEDAASHILITEKQISAIASRTSNIITAGSNERLAHSNARSQKMMLWLTVAIFLLTLIMGYEQIIKFISNS
ncbi:MAG: hypothetical protein CVU15_00980 [Betaproteobacteria bacterium HGW-Betaproteobacteria-1]|jgi:hypothetical protein|nr:MAG: hypothetical protein CVU15_00980 [Betaproteobacteria bacterium HGW-Betaproteobacteria-1]